MIATSVALAVWTAWLSYMAAREQRKGHQGGSAVSEGPKKGGV